MALAAPPRYSFLDLGTFGGSQSEARAISDSGRVTGWAWSAAQGTVREYNFENGTWTTHTGTVQSSNAFLFESRGSGGVMVNIGLPGEVSAGEAINNGGRVVGTVGEADNYKRAFRLGFGPLDETVDESFFHPDIHASVALDINDRNQIVGNTYLPNGHGAFVYRNNEMVSLGNMLGSPSWARAINNNGQVAADSFLNPGYTGPIHAVIHDTRTGQTTDLGTLVKQPKPFDPTSNAFDISETGMVVGVSHVDSPNFGESRAFLYDGTTMMDLGTLPGDIGSDAYAINESGQVVGRSQLRAFMWDDGVMYDLNALTDGLPAGFRLAWANDINESGQIVGAVYDTTDTYHAFLLTPQGSAGSDVAMDLSFDDITQSAGQFSPSVNPFPLMEPVPEPAGAALMLVATGLLTLRRQATARKR